MKKIVFIVFSVILSVVLFSSCKSKDETIQKDVQTILMERHPGITSTVSNHIVTLMGAVESEAEKVSAEADIRGVKDVKSVVNNIEVRQMTTPNNTPMVNPNDEIRNNITSSLSSAGFNDVRVEVRDGEVILTGNVQRNDLQRVMQIANEANNVTKVTNNLTVR